MPEPIDQKKYVFPDVSQGPALFYEDEKHEVWIGLSFEKLNNAVMIMAYLDKAKFDVLLELGKWATKKVEEEKEKSRIEAEKQAFKDHLSGKNPNFMKNIIENGKKLVGIGG